MNKRAFFLFFTLVLFQQAHAQQKKYAYLHRRVAYTHFLRPPEDTIANKNKFLQVDAGDLLGLLFHKPILPGKNDSLIMKPVFSVVPAIGYTLQSRLVATLAGNCIFRLVPGTRLSTITASASYTQNSQFTMPILSNLWTKNNRFNLIGDFRYYKYPQSTFGLGTATGINSEDPMDYSYFRFYEIVLRQLTGNLYAGAGYILDYHWNISHQNTFDTSPASYEAYGPDPNTISSGLTLNALFDNRDNNINPTKGMYISVRYRHNDKRLGSTYNWHSLLIDVRKYYHFPAGSKNILAFWSYEWLDLNGHPPYLDLPATSWDAFSSSGRGYIQGRFRGAQMVYGETEYRFGITRNGLLGGILFANAETLSAAPGTSLQTIQPGYGAGVRIKLNKVSKTNIAIDYGFGTQGSKGLFINIGELF